MEFYRLHSSVIVVAANMNIHLSVFEKGSVAERFLSYGFSFQTLCCIFYVLIKSRGGMCSFIYYSEFSC